MTNVFKTLFNQDKNIDNIFLTINTEINDYNLTQFCCELSNKDHDLYHNEKENINYLLWDHFSSTQIHNYFPNKEINYTIERNQNDYSFLIGFFLNKEILNEYKLTKSLIEVETQCKDKPKIRKTKI